MKIELEWPEDEVQLRQIYSPQTIGGAFAGVPEDDPSRPWLVYVKAVNYPTYFGAFGKGRTPQAAMDDALAQVRAYVARNPNGAYATAKADGLDLSFLGDI